MNINAYDVPGFTVAFDLFVRTGLFAAVKDNPKRQPEFYATACSVSGRGTRHLFQILAAAHVLFAETQDSYELTEFWAKMDERLPGGLIGDWMYWTEMRGFVERGDMPRHQRVDNQAEIYAKKVFTVRSLYAPMAIELAKDKALRYPKTILDIGAGSGVWSLAMPCEVVFFLDQLPVLEALRTWILQNAPDRIPEVRFIEDDFHKPFDNQMFDRIVIANVLHLEQNPAELIKNWVQNLNDDGQVVVIDNFGDNDLSKSLYGMHLAMRTIKGRNHPLEDIIGWFNEAGLTRQMFIPFGLEHPQSLAAIVFERSE